MLNNIDVNSLIDKNNPEAIETSNIAKILFGDDYIIAFNKYIFGYKNTKDGKSGKIYDTLGNIVIDKELVDVAPMIILDTKEIAGYLLLGKSDREKSGSNSSIKLSDSNFLDNIKTWLDCKTTVDVLTPDGKLDKAALADNYTESSIIYRIAKDGVSYKNKVYRVVEDYDSSINYLIHTGKVGN